MEKFQTLCFLITNKKGQANLSFYLCDWESGLVVHLCDCCLCSVSTVNDFLSLKYKISLGKVYFKNLKTGEVVADNTPNIDVNNVTANLGNLTQNIDGTYQGQIGLDESPVTITITAEWISTDDEIDTLNGYSQLNVIIPITVTVEQDI